MQFLKDVRALTKLPKENRFSALSLYEYPFDHELLTLSRLYRESRKHYIELGGRFHPRIASTMRSLSASDLFADEIDYTPAATEIEWFAANEADVYDPKDEIFALERFNTISVFHEQNHRTLWRLLPPAPKDRESLRRYLNLAESLIVMLDLALADEIGPKLSPTFERMKVIYRTGSASKKARAHYRDYLLAAMCATYFILELMNPEDILKAVNYVRPHSVNREAVKRALDINELFTRITNPEWQERSWKDASKKLARLHRGSGEDVFYVTEDPLDFKEEFVIARSVLDHFNVRG